MSWTVDGGPIYAQGNDFWDQIATDLANDDVSGAAPKLRRNLEVTMAELAASIRGQVIFRHDNNYELEACHLLPGGQGTSWRMVAEGCRLG